MTWNIRRHLLLGGRVFSPADEGQGGEGGDGDGGQPPGDGGEGEGGATKPSSILDLASKDGDETSDGDGYKAPDFIPEHLRGKDADDTLAKLNTAYKGARDAMAKGKGKLEGAVPEAPEGYQFKSQAKDGEKDATFEELTSEASKPMVSLAQKAAHKMGIPEQAFEGFMREFISGAAEAGFPIGIDDGEAQEISSAAEMEKLTQLVGDSLEAKTLVNTVSRYGDNLFANGKITEADRAEFNVMVGTAESAHLFYRILTGELGEKPIPLGDGAEGEMTSVEAYAAHAKASSMPEGAERDAALALANRGMQKAFGNQSAGSVRSSVL